MSPGTDARRDPAATGPCAGRRTSGPAPRRGRVPRRSRAPAAARPRQLPLRGYAPRASAPAPRVRVAAAPCAPSSAQLLGQAELLDLARCGQRKLVDLAPDSGHLEARQPRARELLQLRGV